MNTLEGCLRDLRAKTNEEIAARPMTSEDAREHCEPLRGYEQGMEAALTRSSLWVEEVIASASKEIDKVRSEWTAACDERLSREAAEGRMLLENKLADAIAGALFPIVSEWQLGRLRHVFGEQLKTLMEETAIGQVRLSGPSRELECVVDVFGSRAEAMRVVPRESNLVLAEVGDAALALDLEKWASALAATIVEGQNV